MSSKPTTETSSGTRQPASRSARIAPIAEISLNANSAVNASPVASSFRVTPYPTSGEGDPLSSCPTSRSSISRPNSFAAPRSDSQRISVSKLNKMLHCELGGERMVQYDVRYAFHFAVRGHCHDGNQCTLLARRVHRDQPLNRALLQQPRIFQDQIGPVPMADHKIKIALFQQVVLNAGHYQSGVSFADLRHNHSDGKTPLRAQRPSHEVRPVVQLSCC